jgi:hypothetical protein
MLITGKPIFAGLQLYGNGARAFVTARHRQGALPKYWEFWSVITPIERHVRPPENRSEKASTGWEST